MTISAAIPAHPDELTAAWLTAALHDGGHLPLAGRVARVQSDRIGEGVGFVGLICRLQLTYEGDAGDAPGTVIAKMPALEEGGRALANMYGLYEREGRFYAEFAQECGFATARCYHNAIDPVSAKYLLLLEDLAATGTMGDQVRGCRLDEALLAARELGRVHGHWWGNPRLEEFAWLQPAVDLVREPLTGLYAALWPVFLQRFGDKMPADVRGAIETLGPRVLAMFEEMQDDVPWTLAHGDYRLDNMFFGNADAPYRLAVLDWQSPNRNWGAYDISYFIVGNMSPEERRAREDTLLAAYHASLMAHGASGYTLERLHEDYRRSLLGMMAIGVINGATLEITNDRAVQLFDIFFDRFTSAITDLDALALLPPV